LDVSVEVSPEFDKKESILWALIIEFLQPALFFREFVIDLPYIYSLQTRKKNVSTRSIKILTVKSLHLQCQHHQKINNLLN